MNCAEPDVPNGSWESGSRPPYGLMATVTYRCNEGYTMTGRNTFSCQINSEWKPTVPKCERKCIKNDYVIMAEAEGLLFILHIRELCLKNIQAGVWPSVCALCRLVEQTLH